MKRLEAPDVLRSFWSMPTADVLSALQSSPSGLTTEAAAERLARIGPNVLGERKRSDTPTLLLRQVTSPLVLLLIAAAMLSFALHDPTDGIIILSIIGVSALLGFWQERGAARAVEKLLATVAVRASVLRDGRQTEVAVEELVPGDVVLLSAGSIIPADCLLLDGQDLFVDEALLTGESFPVHKSPGTKPADAPLAQRDNVLFMGTHVVSGSGRALVVHTGGRPSSARSPRGCVCARLKRNSSVVCAASATC